MASIAKLEVRCRHPSDQARPARAQCSSNRMYHCACCLLLQQLPGPARGSPRWAFALLVHVSSSSTQYLGTHSWYLPALRIAMRQERPRQRHRPAASVRRQVHTRSRTASLAAQQLKLCISIAATPYTAVFAAGVLAGLLDMPRATRIAQDDWSHSHSSWEAFAQAPRRYLRSWHTYEGGVLILSIST